MYRIYKASDENEGNCSLTGVGKYSSANYYRIGRKFKSFIGAITKCNGLSRGWVTDDSNGPERVVHIKGIDPLEALR